jgi:hypothetical protein
MKFISIFLSFTLIASVSAAYSPDDGFACITTDQVEFMLKTELVKEGLLNIKAMTREEVFYFEQDVQILNDLLSETKYVRDSSGKPLSMKAETDSIAGGGYYKCSGVSYEVNCDGSGLKYKWYSCYAED